VEDGRHQRRHSPGQGHLPRRARLRTGRADGRRRHSLLSAEDGADGYELWKSDGTEAGTLPVKDIRPGSSSSSPYRLTNVAGTLFFSADDGATGDELWKSDGTDSGTLPVADIRPGASSSNPNRLTNVAGTLFFSANDGTTGIELWKSDGTPGGTDPLRDINVGPTGSFPGQITDIGGTAFFVANDGTTGVELWKSDGTPAGTLPVDDIRPGAGSASIDGLLDFDGTAYFGADDGATGEELWKSDGTSAGTELVEDVRPGGPNSSATPLLPIPGGFLFNANDGTTGTEIWKAVDATAPDTQITSGPTDGSTITTDSAVFAFSGTPGDETAKLQCSLDGAAFADCTSPKTFENLADGQHTVAFRAVDEFGNADASPAERTFAVDAADDPSNEFTPPAKGKADTKKGTLTLTVELPGPGLLEADPPTPGKKALIKHSEATSEGAGDTKIKIKPSKKAARKLKKLSKGKKTGKLKITVDLTFTPDGGEPNTESAAYKLKKK
jgi:ELWxxDGT repeat protein